MFPIQYRVGCHSIRSRYMPKTSDLLFLTFAVTYMYVLICWLSGTPTFVQMNEKVFHSLFLFVPDTIDKILGDDDLNNNGYLSYYEFIESRLIDQQYQVIL